MNDLIHTTNADTTALSAFALPVFIREILARFDAAGYEVFCVGGCVRDLMRGVTPHDWDLCTAALPEQTLALFADKTCLTVGIRHGTVTVMWEKHPVEITTYRCESAYVGHRAPSSVTFTPSLHEDCLRRDFTVNAMAYHPTVGLRDDFGGADDLRAGILRCVGVPAERFDEDALRIMRALRFAAVLCFQIDAETAAALHTCAPLLQSISGERIFAEFRQMLMGDHAPAILSEYADVIGIFYPPLGNLRGQENRIAALVAGGEDAGKVAYFALDFVAKNVIALAENARAEKPELPIIFAGGVMRNKIIREKITKKLKGVLFADVELSSDNAVGTAYLGLEKLTGRSV